MNLQDPIIQAMMFRMDDVLLEHCVLVADYIREVAKEMDLEKDIIVTAAAIHDIGKLHLSPSIKQKRTGLSKIQEIVLSNHSYYSYLEAKENNLDDDIANIVLLHHGERCLPYGLSNQYFSKEVVRYARILETVDGFVTKSEDAGIYDAEMTREETIIYLNKNSDIYNRETIKTLEKLFL